MAKVSDKSTATKSEKLKPRSPVPNSSGLRYAALEEDLQAVETGEANEEGQNQGAEPLEGTYIEGLAASELKEDGSTLDEKMREAKGVTVSIFMQI